MCTRAGDQLQTLLSNVTFDDGDLRGRLSGKLNYDDHRGRDYHIHFELRLRDDKLNGSATTLHAARCLGSIRR